MEEVTYEAIKLRAHSACSILVDAAEMAKGIYERGLHTSLKQTERDRPTFLTEADTAVEALIVERWLNRFKDDGIIGEEDGAKGRLGDSRISIVIDPIDGTVAFSRGIKTYALAIAICVDRVPVAAAIHTQDTIFWAISYQDMKGFYRRQTLKESQGMLPACCSVEWMLDPVSPVRWVVANEMLNLLTDGHLLMKEIWKIAGQHACFASAIGTGIMVANGQLQAYVNPGVCLWDVAPLVPFANAAGLRLTRWDGSDPFPAMFDRVLKDPAKYAKGPQCFDMLMAAPAIHDALLPLLKPYALEREKAAYGS